MGSDRTKMGRLMLPIILAGLVPLWLAVIWEESKASASELSSTSLQEQGDGLMKNVEEMLAHGGMGDAKAIVHHCEVATRHAESLIEQLSPSDSRRGDAMTPLNEVIRQCSRVSAIGIHADPGLLLNPALKARTAARDSIKALGLSRTNRG